MKINLVAFPGLVFGGAYDHTEREAYIMFLCFVVEIKFRKRRKGGYHEFKG